MTAPGGSSPATGAGPGARLPGSGDSPQAGPRPGAAADLDAGGLDVGAELARLGLLPLQARAAALAVTVQRLERELDATELAAPGA
jgi:hypothetical protein